MQESLIIHSFWEPSGFHAQQPGLKRTEEEHLRQV